MKIHRLDHIHVYYSDPDTSVRFYTGLELTRSEYRLDHYNALANAPRRADQGFY